MNAFTKGELVKAECWSLPVPSWSRFELSIDNAGQIAFVHGAAAADKVAKTVLRRLKSALGGRADLDMGRGNAITVTVPTEAETCSYSSLTRAGSALWESVLVRVSSKPVKLVGGYVRLSLSLQPAKYRMDGQESDAREDVSARAGATCRRDMAVAADVLDAIRNGRLVHYWQPVRSSADSGRVFYHECLTRIVTANDVIRSPGDFIPSLERLGITRLFDRSMVLRVIAELVAHPGASLGVNISAQSAILDDWWVSIFAMIDARPDVAERLIVEITESAAPSLSRAAAFCERLRIAGVKVAIDDFGKGNHSIFAVRRLQPAIVKLDAFLIQDACDRDDGAASLAHLIAYVKTLTPLVVVEGVSTAEKTALVRAAGAPLMQGFHVGMPFLTRSDAGLQHVPEETPAGRGTGSLNGQSVTAPQPSRPAAAR